LPDIIYIQIDGGSENTAKAVLWICELIISKRLCKKIILTRLMVGHTHCDIDAVFGRLWKHVRNRAVLSPMDYARVIEECLTTSTVPAKVKDIFIVPDYVRYLK
jgi:hypothetical protein